MCLPLDVYVFTTMVLSERSLELYTLQAEPTTPTFPPYVPLVSSRPFPRNGRLCQLLALCLKCHRQETWTGFQTFFEFQHSNSYKKNDQTSLHELCVRISNFLKIPAFNSFGPPYYLIKICCTQGL